MTIGAHRRIDFGALCAARGLTLAANARDGKQGQRVPKQGSSVLHRVHG
jgi:hypothetical protein